jgi:hypothetical protein|tara:strand:- start:748 stop:1791 length:1044 start_codon:yes stop_codon:yes gene_type:complete
MKVLISNDGTHAHYYQRMAWANALQSSGIQTALWNCKTVPAFDVFDSFEPDIFLGQSYNLTPDVIKCIYERPHLKIGLRTGDWGDHQESVDHTKYNILYSSPQERELLKRLKEETGQPEFVHIHYNEEAIKQTHNRFESIGIRPVSMMMCADVISYAEAKFDSQLECDIGFVGGYWPYKGQVINEYLFPMLHPIGKYRIKIFGNQPWQVNQYCGIIGDEKVKDLFMSAKICPNLSEPHAQKFGFDINERIFKILYSGGFCVSDTVEGYKMFDDGIVMATCPEDFRDKINYYLDNPLERQQIALKGHNYVKQNHTGFHRAAQILTEFGYKDLSDKLLEQDGEPQYATN